MYYVIFMAVSFCCFSMLCVISSLRSSALLLTSHLWSPIFSPFFNFLEPFNFHSHPKYQWDQCFALLVHDKSWLWFSHLSFSKLLMRIFQPVLVFIVILSLLNGSGLVCGQSYHYLFLITMHVFSTRFVFVTNTKSESIFLLK